MDNYLKDYKPCSECGSQAGKKEKKCSVCGSTKFGKYESNILLTREQVAEQFPEIPKRGLWCELIDFSEKEYSNSWGFYGFLNGEHIENSGGCYSRIRKAVDAAQNWKQRMYEKIHPIKRNTYGTGYMRQG